MGGLSTLKNAYLVSYNLLSLALWVAVLVMKLKVVGEQPYDGSPGWASRLAATVADGVGPVVDMAQKLAWLEPVHVLLGLGRGSLPAAVMQNFGRSMAQFGVLGNFSKARAAPCLPLLYLAWAASEIIRYPYYVLGQLGRSPPYWLMWLRYSAFIVLYPIGIVSEILLYVACLSDIRTAVAERDLYSIRMPNRFNFAFDAYYFVWFGLLVLYPLSGPGLYLYMLAQRKATLRKAKAKASSKDQ